MMDAIQNIDVERWAWALTSALLWLGACLRAWHLHRSANASSTGSILVAYASQTGTAEGLARDTLAQIQQLLGTSDGATLLPLNSVKGKHLQRSRCLLLILSTTGQGTAPENARQFAQRFLQSSRELGHLEYAVLGLGDRRYKRFCGFADDVVGWLTTQGASQTWETLKVDRNDPRTLAQWHQHIESTRIFRKEGLPG